MSNSANVLNVELQKIIVLFPSNHPNFQVVIEDESHIKLTFLTSVQKHELHCTIKEPYLTTMPVWHTTSDNESVNQVIEHVSTLNLGTNYKVTVMLRVIIDDLCTKFDLNTPENLKDLGRNLPPEDDADASSSSGDEIEKQQLSRDVEMTSEEDGSKNAVQLQMPGNSQAIYIEKRVKNLNQFANPGIFQIVEEGEGSNAIEANQLVKPPNVQVAHDAGESASSTSKSAISPVTSEALPQTKSTVASKRLMKELSAIKNSKHVQEGYYKVNLVEDNLFEWHVDVFRFDPESMLHRDLMLLKERGENDSIGLRISFKDNYPFDPPFIRVVYPMIMGGYVLEGGAICLEVLTSDGWSGVYTIEALILQVLAAFAKGNARVMFGQSTASYNYPNAVRSFSRLSIIHQAAGWYTPFDDES